MGQARKGAIAPAVTALVVALAAVALIALARGGQAGAETDAAAAGNGSARIGDGRGGFRAETVASFDQPVYVNGEIRSLIPDTAGARDDRSAGLGNESGISSFGEDSQGRLWFANINDGRVAVLEPR